MAINEIDVDPLPHGIIPYMTDYLSSVGSCDERNSPLGSPNTMNQVVAI
jgi:hypothetical protein